MKKVITKYVELRFYGNLNDFIHPRYRHTSFKHGYTGNPTVKDIIESTGVPHVEVSLVLVNGTISTLGIHLDEADRITCFPRFHSFDIGTNSLLAEEPEDPRFILDVHLGKLAKYLRIIGFDTIYRSDYMDLEIIQLANQENRIILTRDLGILRNGSVRFGYFIRSAEPKEQIKEVIYTFGLKTKAHPFSRCSLCNSEVVEVEKEKVLSSLNQNTKKYYHKFFRCTGCGQIYWEGSHFDRMVNFINGNLS